MMGLDCLRKELEKRGMNRSQIESKVVAVVLDILTDSGDRYTSMHEAETDATTRLKEIKYETSRYEEALEARKKELKELESQIEKAKEHKKHCEDYIDKFNESLRECETPEGRDVMRAAQTFVNSVSVNTAYDNTAYIKGLASILSHGGINALNEMQKVDKKFPHPEYRILNR